MRNTPPVRRLCLQLAVLATFCVPIYSQVTLSGPITASDAPEPVYTTTHLAAVVVSSLDGRPVPRVLVTSPDRRLAVLTDYEGRFSFDLRRPASQSAPQIFSSFPPTPTQSPSTLAIQFQVRKPGYIADTVTLRLPAVQPDTPEAVLQLKIVPAAVVTGHLYPESGDLPAYVSVQLRNKTIRNGIATWAGTFTATVNSHGEFRFANLHPGDYKLLAPAFDPQFNLKNPLPDSIPGSRASYYPNADSLDSAAIIHLGPGQTSTFSLTYRPTTFYNVTIPVTGLPDGKGFFVHMLADLPGLSLGGDSNRHAVLGYLPSGDYSLVVASEENGTRENPSPASSIASVHLHIDGKPVLTQPVAFQPSIEIPVVAHREFTAQQPTLQIGVGSRPAAIASVSVESLLSGGLQPRAELRTGTDEIALIRNLSEGLFHVWVVPSIEGYVASVTSGSTDLLREPLGVIPGSAPRPIEVTLRDDSATLTGTFLLNGAPMSSTDPGDGVIFVICIPLDRLQSMVFPNSYSAWQPQFKVPNLAPGRYLVLASRQSMQNIEFRNEDVLRDLLGKGTVVTLAPNQKADIQVPLMTEDAN
jgi:hypothetical protein